MRTPMSTPTGVPKIITIGIRLSSITSSIFFTNMKSVEIEEQVSAFVELPFDLDEFPYAFLEAFENKSDQDGVRPQVFCRDRSHGLTQ